MASKRYYNDIITISKRCFNSIVTTFKRWFNSILTMSQRSLNDGLRFCNDIMSTLKRYFNIVSLIFNQCCSGFLFGWPTFFFCLVLFLSVSASSDPASRICIRCGPNKLRTLYPLLSPRRKEIVDTCMSSSFFKCRMPNMSSFLMEHLLDTKINRFYIKRNWS